jgi:hypothetical protein
MTTNYQKYLERKRQKGEKKKTTTRPGNASWMAQQIALAASGLVRDCLVPETLFEKGLGNLVFSRSLPDGRIALAMILLDVYCLGVKNAFFTIIERDEYNRRLSGWIEAERLRPMSPACFRKLVEGAVAYARELGLEPHADYAQARQIFGDLEAADCTENFEYGHEGKPFYISGPNETTSQAKAIVEKLRQRMGEGNFEFLIVE